MRRSVVCTGHRASMVCAARKIDKSKLPEFMRKDDFDSDEGMVDSKVSKPSMDKIKQRFTKEYKRPDKATQGPQSEEEKTIRLFIHKFNEYRSEIQDKRDREEMEKSNYQWEAVAELPEDLRKIAMYVDTHEDMPDWIPMWTLTPPTENPTPKIVLKKKVQVTKRSEETLKGDLF
eukprot:gene7209-8373_t